MGFDNLKRLGEQKKVGGLMVVMGMKKDYLGEKKKEKKKKSSESAKWSLTR